MLYTLENQNLATEKNTWKIIKGNFTCFVWFI